MTADFEPTFGQRIPISQFEDENESNMASNYQERPSASSLFTLPHTTPSTVNDTCYADRTLKIFVLGHLEFG